MPVNVGDGKGRGFQAAVNSDNEMEVHADSNPRGSFVSKDNGRAFVWTSAYSASTASDEIIYLRNTSVSLRLYIDEIVLGAAVAGLYEVFDVSDSTTPGGATSSGQNLNLASGIVPDSSSIGNAAVTALTLGDRIGLIRIGASDSKEFLFADELILGQNDAIAVTFTIDTTSPGNVNAMIRGYYDA